MSYFFVFDICVFRADFRLFLQKSTITTGSWIVRNRLLSSWSDLVFYRCFARMSNARCFALIDCRLCGLFGEFAVRYSERYGFYYCLPEFVVFCSE